MNSYLKRGVIDREQSTSELTKAEMGDVPKEGVPNGGPYLFCSAYSHALGLRLI